ncbi:MAG: hypothetical protein ACXQT2_02675 [Methanotrichaceae archaeon]
MPLATVSVVIPEIPEEYIGVRVLLGGRPVSGATVSIISKGVVPVKLFEKTTDESGVATFNVREMLEELLEMAVPDELLKAIEEQDFLLFAYVDGSPYGYWEDDARFKLGEVKNVSLKEYTQVPTFFVKFYLKDIIGAEVFSKILSAIEQQLLPRFAGVEVVKVEGEGTRELTIYFRPPFEHGSIVIHFTASKEFLIAVIVLVAGILGAIALAKWAFGEALPPVTGMLLLAITAVAVAPVVAELIKMAKKK